MFVATVGGGGVQNDSYARLEQFIELEKNHKLEYAKQNPQEYDSMLNIDIQEFKNSDEFMVYLKKHDNAVDIAEAISIGWLFLVVADIMIACLYLIRYGFSMIKNRFLISN